MSTPAHFDSEIISQTDGAQYSRVPTQLPDDPYVAVRQRFPIHVVPSPETSSDDLHLTVGQAHTHATIDTESEPEEAPSEIEEFLPLVSKAPLTDEEFKASEPSDTMITSSHSTASSDSTTSLSPDHPLPQTSPAPTRGSYYCSTVHMAMRTQPTLSPGLSARIAEAATFPPPSFCKRYKSFYEMLSPSSSLTLPIRKRYQGTSELVVDTDDKSSDSDTEGEGSEDEGPGS
ncbi:hypothetical protein Tco_0166607, partial [Tanacetum coccineum]